MLKRELAGLNLALDRFNTKWEGVIKTISKDKFTRAFQWWLGH